ncbi:hypothetical protein ITI46_32350 [Streptomyces oryzae]|uniref:Uncharacterized protein n=1 Tax=Streptomyces oryzae TaxID=1434886 RepID=A0ABS3XMS3_9ACTN|nr:hypothetical protein [Streptomyces oryzae]MBO8196297.1 hypothetical protein [Streptomyces oryzae]
MRRFPLPSRTATTIAALTVTALVPLCGVAQAAAPSDTAPSASAPAPGAGSQDDARSQGGLRLPKLGNSNGALGLGLLGLL